MTETARLRISYVLPLRWSDDSGLHELTTYLRWLARTVGEVIVVDGSEDAIFRAHAEAFGGLARHVPPDRGLGFAMGKVDGVTTGVLAASHERVVVADDDVRYDEASLRRAAALLEKAELVRPQNYFDPLPWHARLDMARSLLNRVHSLDPELGAGDFPGTLAIRRSAFEAMGGYDGDVMFENLELMRTVSATGGRVLTPLDLYVRRLPPRAAHFLSQRVRQAYDDFAIPARMAAALAVVPAVLLAAATGRWRAVLSGAAALAGIAEGGRRRAGGRRYFPAASSLLAPIWVLERGVSAWLAVRSRVVRGGIPYSGSVIRAGANDPKVLRKRHGGVGLPRLRAEPDALVGAVAEGQGPGAPAAAERDGAPA